MFHFMCSAGLGSRETIRACLTPAGCYGPTLTLVPTVCAQRVTETVPLLRTQPQEGLLTAASSSPNASFQLRSRRSIPRQCWYPAPGSFCYSLMVKMISGLWGWHFRFSQSLSTYGTGCRGNYITGLTNGNNPLLSERITVSQHRGKLKTRSFFCGIYLIFYSVICLQQY